ncbi:hypothetical protein LCGC14_2942090, partial [marine sediment metagenome]
FGDPRLPAHFWAKVRIGSAPVHRPDLGPCWEWIAGRNSAGYGCFYDDGKPQIRAHRFAYEKLIGPILVGLEADHLCRLPPCVNPNHIEPVTHRENILRGNTGNTHNSIKTHCPQGHPYGEANTYRYPDGRRSCRACSRSNRRRERKRGRN